MRVSAAATVGEMQSGFRAPYLIPIAESSLAQVKHRRALKGEKSNADDVRSFSCSRPAIVGCDAWAGRRRQNDDPAPAARRRSSVDGADNRYTISTLKLR